MIGRVAWNQARGIRLLACVTVAVASSIMLAWGYWPQARTTAIIYPEAGETAIKGAAASAGGVRTSVPGLNRGNPCIAMEFPAEMRLGDQDLVNLAFNAEPSCLNKVVDLLNSGPSDAAGSSLETATESQQFILQAVLDLPGARWRPYDSIRQPLVEDHSTTFTWSVMLPEPGTYRGTAWLSLVLGGDRETSEEQLVMSAQSLQLQTKQLAGMNGETARVGGAVGMLASGVLALAFARRALHRRWPDPLASEEH